MNIFLSVVAVVIGLLSVMYLMKRLQQAKVTKVFQSLYGTFRPRPTLEFSSNYGFPSFCVLFKTKEELEKAEASGVNGQFREFISLKYKSAGTVERPFDVEQAVSFIYDGYISEVVARITSKHAQERRGEA